MKFFQGILKDQKGSESIGFLVYTIIIIYILIQFVEIVTIGVSQVLVTMAYKKGLDQMQIDGGLTLETENHMKSWLAQFGIEPENVTIEGTIAPVEWGQDVNLKITYRKPYFKYSLLSVTNIGKSEEYINIPAEGGTTSYWFDNNYEGT